eukprot:PhM_4_TR1341/c0_g1_i1/m.96559
MFSARRIQPKRPLDLSDGIYLKLRRISLVTLAATVSTGSASALEAACEKRIWMATTKQQGRQKNNLGRGITSHSVLESDTVLQWACQNPKVIVGKSDGNNNSNDQSEQRLFDAVDGMGKNETIEFLEALVYANTQ